MAAAAAKWSAVAAVASMCSVGELRAGEEGSCPDLAGDDAGAVQRVEVLPKNGSTAADDDGTEMNRMNSMNPNRKYSFNYTLNHPPNYTTQNIMILL
jgi:hypothetical protein